MRAVYLSLFFVILLKSTRCSQPKWCNIYEKHTLCLYSSSLQGPGCGDVRKSSVNRDERKSILSILNKLRSRVASGFEYRGRPGPQPPAANMRQLVWDDELAEVAQAWVNQCNYTHDCRRCRSTSRFSETGQVMYEWLQTEPLIIWNNAIGEWYDQVGRFNKYFVDYFQFSTTLEGYSQLIWAKSFAVGCGFLQHKNEDTFTFESYYVCNFGPRGNLLGTPMYQVGEPCSMCLNGTTCSLTYPGLCEGQALGDDAYSYPGLLQDDPGSSQLSSTCDMAIVAALLAVLAIYNEFW